MSNQDRVLAFLRSISPADASNAEIVARTGIKPHQQVFIITRDLRQQGLIRGLQEGKGWRFWAGKKQQRIERAEILQTPIINLGLNMLSPAEFEKLAQGVMSKHYGVALAPNRAKHVPKVFDLVSRDVQIVGDAKYYTLVGGERFPPAKFSVIAEHVWLLEKTNATHRFLVFGNDRRVVRGWLDRYGHLAPSVEFFFLDAVGELEHLNKSAGAGF